MEQNDDKFIATAASCGNENKRHTPDETDRKRVASPVEGRPAKRVLTKDGKMVQPDAPPPKDTGLGLDFRNPVSEDPDLSIQDQAGISSVHDDTSIAPGERPPKRGRPIGCRRKPAKLIKQGRQLICEWKTVERLEWSAIHVKLKQVLDWDISVNQIKKHYNALHKGSKQKIEKNVNKALDGVKLGLLPDWKESAVSALLDAARNILNLHEGTTGTEDGGNDVDNQDTEVIDSEAGFDNS
jgi:hypothetical protein